MVDPVDAEMMRRAIALAVRSGEEREYPYGVVISRGGAVVAEMRLGLKIPRPERRTPSLPCRCLLCHAPLVC